MRCPVSALSTGRKEMAPASDPRREEQAVWAKQHRESDIAGVPLCCR